MGHHQEMFLGVLECQADLRDWLLADFDQTWFREALQAAAQAYHACTANLIVGSSMGGAVAT